ncbi:MAG: 4-hydroxy-tetrahydrodipicolinate synthase [Varibaculum cambriense]|uniref:4-hydroxy-tetrahydrodipicolinate synthase n=1 Tax=Varibaculum cambriense TaxID=184870 RepID=UPI002913A085|nr:4-hydroxy-tetrahydrodipicolinate synthase [Varibaculum cambriense]MDU4244279.1 4-hydroxy-tetrahydrodipicolinate synthase [Varibaculum cambriense]MDU5614445.1 4-hydroxy-tetrahydrodipicolinate synthase [Varibaculum cambriense]MDU6680691.1 4-hydroxy-tetrahydrodipicolinate synthase [Varibaculum cambriense]
MSNADCTYRLPAPVGVAMVTPFHPDGSVDYDAAASLAKHLVDQGIDHLVLSGTTGESPTTHLDEKEQLIKSVRQAVGKDLYITAGAGSNDTEHSVRMARSAQAAGADGILLVSPYYSRPSQEGLYQHFAKVASETDLPVMLYDIPGRTGVAISDELMKRLAEIDNIVAVKDATGKVEVGARRIDETGLAFYSGDDGLNYSWLTQGAVGVISVVGHVAAPSYRKMVQLVENGDYQEALQLSLELEPLVKALMGGGQGAVMAKHALALQKVIPSDTLRLPLAPASEEDIAQLRAALESFGLL